MALNLSKGNRFNLAKDAPKMKVAGIGLGWNPNKEENVPHFELDVSAFLVGENGKIPTDDYAVFYGSELKMDTPDGPRPYSGDGSVLGTIDLIDNRTIDREDDEDLIITFNKIWEGIHEVVITVTICKYPNDKKKDRRTLLQNFSMVEDCYIRLWDYEAGVEIFRYNLNEKFTNEDAVEFGRFIRLGNSWEFIASGEKYTGGLNKFIEIFT